MSATNVKRRSVIRSLLIAAGTLLAELVQTVSGVARRGSDFVETWLVDDKHARYGLAVTRMLLGAAGLGLLLSNFSTRLYTFGSGSAWNGEAAAPVSDFPQIWLFSLFHRLALNDVAFTVAYLALAVLAVLVILGWRMKIVLPVYFVGWVSFIEMNDAVGDQGDNAYRITLLALLFADTASRWSLDARRRARFEGTDGGWLTRHWRWQPLLPTWTTNLAHNLVLVVVTAHVSFIYVSGALYKAGGTPWQQGYAIYNPLQTQRFGTWPELSDLVTAWAPATTVLSWSSIILQLAFPLMLMRRPTRIIALFGILSFHIGIAVLMGLPWFSLAMIAVDAIFVRDASWQSMSRRIVAAWRGAREAPEPVPDDPLALPAESTVSAPAPAPASEREPVGAAQ